MHTSSVVYYYWSLTTFRLDAVDQTGERGLEDIWDINPRRGEYPDKVYLYGILSDDGVERKIRTHLDLLSIPQLEGEKYQNV